MIWFQKILYLSPRPRGFHLVQTDILKELPELKQLRIGQLHLLLQHTSASLCLNENADPSVRVDFESFFNETVRENEPYFIHTDEGPDDMPAHLKTALLGSELTLPVTNGQLNLGTWQGVYLGEHRNNGGSRKVIATLSGTQ